MMATPADRARELERMYQMRRGHAPQISISDESHHVTEAIGDMYGGGDSDSEMTGKRSSRPLSFLPDPRGDAIQSFDPFPSSPPARSPLRPQMSGDNLLSPTAQSAPNNALSPPLPRSGSDTASQQFPLNHIDYESSPAGLAQELSNLQAIRRMSMGVNGADPDLPSFQSASSPAISPSQFSEEADPSALFWVPARLHPELAPVEFKTFIEDKIDKTRRRSGDSDSLLSPDGAPGRQGSVGGLRRKKSMLSRQVDSGVDYKDGAERLQRTKSGRQINGGLSNVQELEHIIEDPATLVRRMSISASEGEAGLDGDAPIVSGKVGPGAFLKRSTRTTYRRGSLRKGGPPLSRRMVTRQTETDTEDSPSTSPTHSDDVPDVPRLPLNRIQSEPINSTFDSSSNLSRSSPRPSLQGDDERPGSAEDQTRPGSSERGSEERPRPQPKKFHSRIASNGRTTAPLPGYNPPQEPDRRSPLPLPERNSSRQPPLIPQPQQPQQPLQPLPPQQQPNGPRQPPQPHTLNTQQQRSPVQPQPQPQPLPLPLVHSQSQPQIPPQSQPSPSPPPQQRQSPSGRPNRHAQTAQASPINPSQSLEELAQRPSPLPGQSSTRTDNLSFAPTLSKEEKMEPKLKVKKDESGARKTSWGWLVGNNQDKERDKKEKEEREKEAVRRVKNKLSKPQEKSHDDTRLDLLQSSMQRGNGSRESVVLDRESIRLEEERKKESSRKTSIETKKEKEPGLLSSIFGGGKKKNNEKELAQKKNAIRGLSPEPPPRILKPDIDYNWTRFSILEERAIYRMAHIKLANPKRELYSQVLLSNFMYSYLAKVQQMHPQIQIGNSKQAKQAQQQQQAAQQRKEQQQQMQQQQQKQPEEFAQYQRYQQQQQQQQVQSQSEQTSEWPSIQPKQDAHSRAFLENGHEKSDPARSTSPYNQSPRDSHHSQHSTNTNGSKGYSVANTQNYLGQAGKHGQLGGYSDSDQDSRGDDDMW